MCSGHLQLRNFVLWNHGHLVTFMNSVQLEFRKSRARMACLCSTMLISGVSAGKRLTAMRSGGKGSNEWWCLDLGHSIWVDGGVASWNGEDLLGWGADWGDSGSQWTCCVHVGHCTLCRCPSDLGVWISTCLIDVTLVLQVNFHQFLGSSSPLEGHFSLLSGIFPFVLSEMSLGFNHDLWLNNNSNAYRLSWHLFTMYIYIYIYKTCLFLKRCPCTSLNIYIHTCTIYIHTYTCMCICVCVWRGVFLLIWLTSSISSFLLRNPPCLRLHWCVFSAFSFLFPVAPV